MDMKKLCELITAREDLKDIPITHIFRVAYAVFEVMGDCFYEKEEE